MATYKVIQDIEAEDKLLGPLTFRQFVYAGTCVLFLYFSFLAVTKGAGVLATVFVPVSVFTGFFAWPWSRDQPTEIWALAKIRFLIKPRKRIWNQSGVKELVTVTAPKRVDVVYTNGLSQTEVQNRLRALADTIDSRGWATKNVNVNLYTAQGGVAYAAMPSDRLVSASSLPQAVPEIDVHVSDDMMEESSHVARQFDTMIAASTKAHREEILEHLRDTSETAGAAQTQAQSEQSANNYWFLQQQPGSAATVPSNAVTFNTQVVTPGVPIGQSTDVAAPTPLDEAALIEQLHEQDRRESINPYNRWHTLKPLSEQQAAAPPAAPMAQSQQSAAAPPTASGSPLGTAGNFPFMQQPQSAPMQPAQQPTNTGYAMPATPAPYSATPQAQQTQQTPPAQVTQQPDPAILQLASNDDLDVATIAREANKRKELQDEVVISLH